MNINEFLNNLRLIAVNIIKTAIPVIMILVLVDIVFKTKLNVLTTILSYFSKVGISKDHLAIMIFIAFGIWIVKRPAT